MEELELQIQMLIDGPSIQDIPEEEAEVNDTPLYTNKQEESPFKVCPEAQKEY